MEELAKLLAEDPRMLRRYMAMLQLQSTSYRDQMTLLAEEQKQLKEQVAKWNATPKDERETLAKEFQASYAKQGGQVVEAATKIRENMETWLPLDVKTDHPEVQAALTRSEKIVQLTAESTNPENTEAPAQALTEMRALARFAAEAQRHQLDQQSKDERARRKPADRSRRADHRAFRANENRGIVRQR